jgi:hypothetical protein
MALIKSIPHRLAKLFLEGFNVMDIAVPLPSFDERQSADEVRAFLAERGRNAVGIRRNGHVQGYALQEELEGGTCGDAMHRFQPQQVVDDSATLVETVRTMHGHDRCFVASLREITAVVRPRDLEKPPGRMWLFGMITIIEVKFLEEIRRRFPGDSWHKYVSAGRLEKTRELAHERARRNQPVDLLDCLQLTDKALLLLRDPDARREMELGSVAEGKRVIKDIGSLRNHLAHAQPFVATDWDIVVRLTERMASLLVPAVGSGDS